MACEIKYHCKCHKMYIVRGMRNEITNMDIIYHIYVKMNMSESD